MCNWIRYKENYHLDGSSILYFLLTSVWYSNLNKEDKALTPYWLSNQTALRSFKSWDDAWINWTLSHHIKYWFCAAYIISSVTWQIGLWYHNDFLKVKAHSKVNDLLAMKVTTSAQIVSPFLLLPKSIPTAEHHATTHVYCLVSINKHLTLNHKIDSIKIEEIKATKQTNKY